MKELDEDVYKNLARIDPIIADIYRGAIQVLNDSNNPDRIYQSAHSIREMIRHLTGKVKVESGKEKENTETLKKKLIKSFDPSGGPPGGFEEIYDKVNKSHNWFVNVSHHGALPSEEEYKRCLEIYESDLKGFFKPYFGVLDEIDKLLLKKSPSAEDLKYLKSIVRTFALSKYFFDKADIRWLDILQSCGIFNEAPIAIKENDGIRFATWPASKYLIRMAQEAPEMVYDIIIQCKIPNDPLYRNISVIEDFVQIALNMPIELMKKLFLTYMKRRWIYSSYYTLLYEYALEGSRKLLDENEYVGKLIIDDLLKIKKLQFKGIDRGTKIRTYNEFTQNPLEKIDMYYLEKIKDEMIEIAAKKFPESTAKYLIKSLLNILKTDVLVKRNFNHTDPYSFFSIGKSAGSNSDMWILRLEEYPQYFHDVREVFAIMIREILEELGSGDFERFKKLMSYIKRQKFGIFRRLELYIYRIFPSYFPLETQEIIFELLGNTETYHEHYILVKEQFPYLKKSLQRKYVKKIQNMIESKRNLKKLRKLGYSEDEIQKSIRIKKMRFYEPINEFLPTIEKKWYDDMIQKGYEPAMKGDLVRYEVFSDCKEGLDIGLSPSMSPKEVFGSLKSYTKTKEYNTSSDEITSEKFESLVRSNPYEYSKLGASLLDLDLKYCYLVLRALLEPIKVSANICWEEILDLCSQLLDNSNEPFSGKREFYFGANPIADFLCTALGRKTALVPVTLGDKVWSVVERLVNLTKNRDNLSFLIAETTIRNDYHFRMINSDLFCSIECLLFYNSWITSSKPEQKVRKLLPEVKQVLNDLLNNGNPTIQVICAFSSNLSYLISLDLEWTKVHLEKIIPPFIKNKVSYYAAWECYLIKNAVRSNTFAVLYPYYLERIRNLKNDPKDYVKSQAIEALIVHVLYAYLLDFNNNSKILFEEFMNNSTNEMLSTCLRKLAFILSKYKQDKKVEINLDRVRQIWELEKFQDSEGFLDLFVNSPFDKRTSISLLHKFLITLKRTTISKVDPFSIRRTISELKDYSTTDPMLKSECILELSRIADKSNCTNLINTQVLENILELKGNTDPKLKEKLEEIKEFYGNRGFNKFRDV